MEKTRHSRQEHLGLHHALSIGTPTRQLTKCNEESAPPVFNLKRKGYEKECNERRQTYLGRSGPQRDVDDGLHNQEVTLLLETNYCTTK